MIKTDTVAAEAAPIGRLLWAVRAAKYAPNFTLVEVQVVRREAREFVRWVYESGKTREFNVGEQVAILAADAVAVV